MYGVSAPSGLLCFCLLVAGAGRCCIWIVRLCVLHRTQPSRPHSTTAPTQTIDTFQFCAPPTHRLCVLLLRLLVRTTTNQNKSLLQQTNEWGGRLVSIRPVSASLGHSAMPLAAAVATCLQ